MVSIGCQGEVLVPQGRPPVPQGRPPVASDGTALAEQPAYDGSRTDDFSGENNELHGGLTAPASCPDNESVAVFSPLRRMTKQQFVHTMEEIFGDKIVIPDSFPEPRIELGITGYSTEALASLSSQGDMVGIIETVENIAIQLVTNPIFSEILPCASSQARACAVTFAEKYGRQAFRRSLSLDELEHLLSAFDDVLASGGDFAQGVGVMAQILFMSPQFLFWIESGPTQGLAVALDGPTLAGQLSAMLWASTPDKELLALGESGEILQPGVVEAQVLRMIQDEKSTNGLALWVLELLDLTRLELTTKDSVLHPNFGPELAEAMKEEIRQLVMKTIRNGGTLGDLLATTEGYVNTELAEIYGVSDVDFTNGPWQLVQLPAGERAGLLTRAAFLSAHASQTESSYVQRGYQIRTGLFCDVLGVPPQDAFDKTPEYPPNSTGQEQSVILRSVEGCAGCHNVMDPAGLVLEVYDAVGGFRTTMPSGRTIDTESEIIVSNPEDSTSGVVANAIELSQRMASSDIVEKCLVRQMLRYSLGRLDNQPEDRCIVERVHQEFSLSGGQLDALIVALVKSDAFRLRRIEL